MSIEVTGGPAGFEVNLADLESAAVQLRQWAADLSRILRRVVAVASGPQLLATARLSPVTAGRAGAALAHAAGMGGVAGDTAGLLVLAGATVSAVRGYRSADSAVQTGIEASRDAVMAVVGRQTAPAALIGVGLHRVGVDVGGLLDAAVFDAPWVVDFAGGAEGLVAGLATHPLTGPALVAAGLGAGDLMPGSYEQAIRCATEAGWRGGMFRDGADVHVSREAQTRAGARAPSSLATLMADLDNLGDAAAYPARVRVVELPQRDGRSVWLVEVPGTQEWQPQSGANPFDVTTDLRAMAHQSTVAAVGVERALAAARLEARNRTGRDTSGEPVMLAGHSLGGILAAGLAADPGFRRRQRVSHVVTFGAPIARVPVPDAVSVLSLEHHQDPVPRLEGEPNPASGRWVTVTRDVAHDPGAGFRGSGAHAPAVYATTAAQVDGSSDPALQQWRAATGAFFAASGGAEPVIRDYRIERLPGQS